MARFTTDQYEQLLAAATTRDHLTGTGATFKLEQRLKQHYGMRHCVLTSSATSAMLATGLATGLRGKEVLVSPMSWGGSIGAFSILGCTFTMGMVEHDSLNLDWHSIMFAKSKYTTAILATDQFGTAHDQYSLRREADRYGLLYIADAASSLGAFDGDGRSASSLADVLIVSFGSGKGITAGEGGAVLTNDEGIYERLVTYSQHPERQRKERGCHNEFTPLAARMHPLVADILLNTFDLQMDRLRDRQRSVHAFIAQHQDRLSTLLSGTGFLLLLRCVAACSSIGRCVRAIGHAIDLHPRAAASVRFRSDLPRSSAHCWHVGKAARGAICENSTA